MGVDNLVDGSCPSIVNQKNWLGGETHGDKFTITNGACVRPAEIANGVYSLKGGRGGKFCASEGNKIVCDRDSVGGWEKYTIEKHGDWYALKAHNGKYCADERYKIVCDRDSVGGWERFNVEKIGEEFALRSDRDHKYCADTPGGVNCLKVIPHHSEMFTIERIADPPPPSPRGPRRAPPPGPRRRTRTAPAREMSLSSASTRNHGWGMHLEFNCHGKTIPIGNSDHQTTTVTVHGIGPTSSICPHIVDKHNWRRRAHWYGDRFEVTELGAV